MTDHPVKLSDSISDTTTQQRKIVAIYIASIICVFLTFLLLFKVPYNGDDMINCLTDGGLSYSNRSLFDHTYSLLQSWMNSGRFYPLAFYSYAMFTAFPTLVAYRSIQIILNMAVIVSFAVFVRKLTANDLLAVAGILIAPVFFQYRYYQDPITAYHGMLQLVALYIILALILHLKGLESGKIRYQLLGMVFYAFSLLTYEISFAFIVLFLVLPFYYEKPRRAALSMLPYIIITSVILSFTLYLRTVAPNPTYAGISFSWDVYGIMKAFLSQLSAAIPLSYWLLATPDFMIYSVKVMMNNISVGDVVIMLLMWALLIISLKNLPAKKAGQKILVFGILLWVLPATILSLSSRYQTELSPGVGYLPVYVQYFGGILIALYVCSLILSRISKERKRKIVSVILVSCFCFGFLLNHVNNRTIQKTYSNNNRQDVSTYAMEQGMMSCVEEGASLLVIEGGYGMNFEPTSFVYKYADSLRIVPKTLQILHDEVVSAGLPVTGHIEPESLYVYIASGDLTNGIAQVAKISAVDYDTENMTITKMYASEIQMVVIGYYDAWFRVKINSQNQLEEYPFSIEGVSTLPDPSSAEQFELSNLSGNLTFPYEISHLDRQDDMMDMIFHLNRNHAEMLSFSAGEGEQFDFPIQTA